MERDVYREIQYVRDELSLLTFVVAEAYGPNFFSYITRNSADLEIRKKYRIISAEGYPLYDSTLRGAVQCLVHPGLPRKDPSVHRKPREGFQEQLCSQGEIRPERLREVEAET